MHSKIFVIFGLAATALAVPFGNNDFGGNRFGQGHRGGAGVGAGAGNGAGAGAGAGAATTTATATATAAAAASTTVDLAAVASSDLAVAAKAQSAFDTAQAAEKSNPSQANDQTFTNAELALDKDDQAARAAEDAAGETLTVPK